MTVRADGRWGGRVTSRPLPDFDPTIADLSDGQRSALSEVWLARAASERRVADSFEVIRDALRDLGADPSLVALADRAVDDEYRHAELSRDVASRYSGAELEPPPVLPLVVPEHASASPELRKKLWIIGQSCMNETIAGAFLEASLEPAKAPLARAALRELLSDEVDHARLGWAFLATLDASDKAEIQPWLLGMAKANLRMWRETPRAYPADLLEQGIPDEPEVEAALLTAFEDLIIPGLERFGFATRAIREWLAAGAPT